MGNEHLQCRATKCGDRAPVSSAGSCSARAASRGCRALSLRPAAELSLPEKVPKFGVMIDHGVVASKSCKSSHSVKMSLQGHTSITVQYRCRASAKCYVPLEEDSGVIPFECTWGWLSSPYRGLFH